MNIVLVEYPNYSFYDGIVSEDKILEDCVTVIEFMNEVLDISYSNIIIMGRSLGSGPATYLASKYNICLLVLISPFTSVKDVVRDSFGYFGSIMMKDQFNNLKRIKRVKSQVLIIHGNNDETIKPQHSKTLQENCDKKCDLIFFNEMSHDKVSVKKWIIDPLKLIMEEIGFSFPGSTSISIPRLLFEKPPSGLNSKNIEFS